MALFLEIRGTVKINKKYPNPKNFNLEKFSNKFFKNVKLPENFDAKSPSWKGLHISIK
jgi:hypothetical protein